MPRYRVNGVVTGGKYLGEFEADTPDAAAELALGSPGAQVGLCHQCSCECEDAQIDTCHVEPVDPEEPT